MKKQEAHDMIDVLRLCRYLVNAGEGTQRICVEHKIKIRKVSLLRPYCISTSDFIDLYPQVEHILLTDMSIRSIGGLTGLCLTAADAGRTQLSVTGPEGLSSFLAATDSFARRSSLTVTAHEASSVFWHNCPDVRIGCIPVPSTSSMKRSHEDTDRAVTTSVCYVFETPQVIGSFDANKARAAGVPAGPLFGKVNRLFKAIK